LHAASNTSALELFSEAWRNNSQVAETRQKLKLCLMGHEMFQGYATSHLFAAENFDRSEYNSWLQEAKQLIEEAQ
jgi:hypothetical protein